MINNKLWFVYVPASLGCGVFYAAIFSSFFGLLYDKYQLGFAFGSKQIFYVFLASIIPFSMLVFIAIKKSVNK